MCSWEFEREWEGFERMKWRRRVAGGFQSIFKCGQHPVNVGQLIKPPGQRKSKLVNKIGDSRQDSTRVAQGWHAGRATYAITRMAFVSWRIQAMHISRTPVRRSCMVLVPVLDFFPFSSVSSLVLESEGPKHLETLGFFKNDFKSCIKTFSKLLYSNVEIWKHKAFQKCPSLTS